ncbi:tetratricopeptide repeat protein [candidate division KSB1 bacterium]|nr:tetratricopeptide repeat protein [candidate division KSB1 bacterium]
MKRILAILLMLALALGMLAGCGKMTDEKLMALGKEMEERENFDEAIGYYEKLVQDYPDSPLAAEALHYVGKVYANGIKDYEQAIIIFNDVIDKYPESPNAAHSQFMIGFVYANSIADTAEARLAYHKFQSNYPEHELVPSVEFELKYLGRDINEIPELMNLEAE